MGGILDKKIIDVDLDCKDQAGIHGGACGLGAIAGVIAADAEVAIAGGPVVAAGTAFAAGCVAAATCMVASDAVCDDKETKEKESEDNNTTER